VLVILIAIIISVSMPITYLILSVADKRNLAAINSQELASKLGESVRDNPKLWMFNATKFTQIQSFYNEKGIAAVKVYDKNHRLMQKVELLEPSYVEISGIWPIKFNNQVYGFVEVVQESNSIIDFATIIFIVFSLLGSLIAYSLYRFSTNMVIRAENEAVEAFRQLHYITFFLGEGVCVTDLDGNLTFTNPAAERMLGWSKGGLLGKNINGMFFQSLWASEELDRVFQIIKQGESRRIYEDSFITKEGLKLPVSYVVSPIVENWKVSGCVLVFHDISRRKQAEIEMRSRVAALRRITDNMLDMISQTDTDGIIRYVTPSYKLVLGYEPEEMLGKSIFDFLHEEDKHRVMNDIRNSIVTGLPQKMEFRFKHANAEYLWLESLCNFLRDDDGLSIIFSTRDVTERKHLLEEVARLDRLHLIGEMAAGIGHEIRNPMTTVRGFLQMLGEKKDNARYKEYFDLMIDELDRANSIIKEYLNLAKNKAIDLKIQNLNPVIDAIYPLIHADATLADKRVLLDLSNVPDLPIDEKEIRQLILNLTRNGLEAMAPGGCLVIKTCIEADSIVVLSVLDQGKGIDSNVLDRLGTPFFTTKEQGTGLGLAVCYSIAARHNAKIEIASGPEGSTFSVKFYQGTNSSPAGTAAKSLQETDSYLTITG